MATHFDPSLTNNDHRKSPNTRDSQSTQPLKASIDKHSSGDSVCNKRHVDIIASSPHEIVSHIFSYIPIQTAFLCTQVSRTWRTQLLQCPEAWHTILPFNRSIMHKLPISQHVQALYHVGTPTQLANNIHFLQTREFNNLKTLSVQIKCPCTSTLELDGVPSVETIIEHLYEALSNVAQSLVELVIESQSEGPGISLNRILSTCRKLTTLKITAYSIIDCALSCTTLLTNVYLGIDDPAINMYDLEPIFSNSPHLRSFNLVCYLEDNIMPVIGTHCPKLSSIITNEYYFKIYDNNPIHARLQDGHQADNLHCLILHYLSSPLTVLSRLQQCRDTLRTLCLAPMNGALSQDWHHLSSFTLPALTYLQINASHIPMDFLYTHLPTMLRSNPSLETLVLQHYYDHSRGADTAAIYNAMLHLPRLSCLRLLCFGICGDAFLLYSKTSIVCVNWKFMVATEAYRLYYWVSRG